MRTLYKFLMVGVVNALFVQVGFAQKENVGIGTTKPDQSAILDLSSTNKGLLMPRVTLQQRNSIQNPANGLIVYQIDLLSGFYFYDGKEWKAVTSETNTKSVADANNWGLTGNAGTTSINFLGTTDAQPLRVKTGGQPSGFIDNTDFGNIFWGKWAGLVNTPSGSDPNAVNSGASNIGIGHQALSSNTTGAWNTAIGFQALAANISGHENMAIGKSAMYFNNSGWQNMAIGAFSLYRNSSGSYNTAVGRAALQENLGSNNTGIGYQAGKNSSGSRSVFIGNDAGSNESSSDKLYIANSNTTTPLIYGDFATKYLAVGEVAASDRAAATSGGYRLLVKGGMITEKIKVAVAGSADWADYVFEPSYNLLTLEKVESFIKENKHLPNVPSADEMSKNGLDVTQTTSKLMEKIEELTLYIIELNKKVKELEIKR